MSSSAALVFDSRLVGRYGLAGPRYTSYPTALRFNEPIGVAQYRQAAASSEDALLRRGLSIYVHIPFCYSPCFYCGCTKIVTRDIDRVERYVGHLSEEISLRGRHFDRGRLVEQMHFGGGTPTYLSMARLSELISRIGEQFQLSDSDERDYSIEIDPRSVYPNTLRVLRELGFNRLSMGIQDFDSGVQRAVNRVQPPDMVRSVYLGARDMGFQSVNFDLIYGLPLQTLDTFASTLDQVIELRPDRLSVYGYAHMPQRFKAQRHIRQQELPDVSARLDLLRLVIEKLGAAGYLYIGLDHFALPSDTLAKAKVQKTLHRSFQGYSTHAGRDLVSFGVSAIGRVGTLFVQNPKLLKDYEAAIGQGDMPAQRGVGLNRDDLIRADVIQQIMCHGEIDIEALQTRHEIQFEEYFCAELGRLQSLRNDGLLDLDGASIRLTPTGQLLMRAVAMTFDAYLAPMAPSPAMSRLM